MTVTVKQLGGSMAVVIPKAMAVDMGLSPGTAVELTQDHDRIVLRKRTRRPRRPLGEIVKQITPGSYKALPGWDDDTPVGKEPW